MEVEKIRETFENSLSGKMKFSDVITTLSNIGVESYRVDLMQKQKCYYMPSGETFAEVFQFDALPVSEKFDDGEIRWAVRESQKGRMNYRDFLKHIMKSGTTSYSVFLQGRKVIYYGRNGDCVIENFPQIKLN